MMQRRYLWVPMSAALFAFSLTSAYAAIRANLETPVAGQSASGIGLVRGWAFAENGNPVTVTLRLDGVPLSSFTVDCCSARQDVQTLCERSTARDGVRGYGELWRRNRWTAHGRSRSERDGRNHPGHRSRGCRRPSGECPSCGDL